MNRQNIEPEKKNTWISITGYRTLFVLKLLIEKNCSQEEITKALKLNSITSKSVSKDTVRITLNTLKKAGCKLSRPSMKNGFKYELISHPFVLELSDEEFNILMKLKSKACDTLSWQKALILNDLYEKIFSLANNDEQIEIMRNSNPFWQIDRKVLSQLANPNLHGKKIRIKYNSPKNCEEVFDIIVGDISYSQEKMYLCCYNLKYNSNSLLNIERIREIVTVYLEKSVPTQNLYEVVYELFGESLDSFEKKDYETVIQNNENSIIVKAGVNNEFCFIQRLLQYGADFKIISPDSFREKLINKIKLIQKRYKND